MANEYNRILGGVTGAADLIFGMAERGQAVRGRNIAAAAALQRMAFDEELQPLRMKLLGEQVAGENLANFGRGFALWNQTQIQARAEQSDLAAGKAFGDLSAHYSAWKGGKAAVGSGALPLSVDIGPSEEGSVYQPGLDGAFGPDLPVKAPAGSDSNAGELLPAAQADPAIPFAADDESVIEGQGDGPDQPSIVEREIEARRRKAMGPESVQLLERLKMTVQAFGGLERLGMRRPELVPHVIEMATNLAADPEAAKWERNQAALVQRQKTRQEVLGLIIGHGLKESDFPDVFMALRQGVPVDKEALKERVKTAAAQMALLGAGTYFGLPEPVRKRTEDLAAAYTKSPEYTNFTLASGYAASVAALASAQNTLVNQNKSPSAAGDIAMVYNYMKVLDPGSAVREGEYATAQNAASVPTRIQNLYNKTLDGNFLTPEQRNEFAASAQTSLVGLKATLQGRQQIIEGQLAGVVPPALMPVVRQQVFGLAAAPDTSAMSAIAPPKKDFPTIEAANAALARKEIKKGEAITVGGRDAVAE